MASKPRKAKAWYVKFPGDVYALGPFRFETPVGIMAVRERVREWEKVGKLPPGVSCWPTND